MSKLRLAPVSPARGIAEEPPPITGAARARARRPRGAVMVKDRLLEQRQLDER
jgi:hypothetical protein